MPSSSPAMPNETTHPNASAFPPGIGGPALRALHNAGIRSLAAVARWTRDDLAALHGIGPKALAMLERALHEQSLAFDIGNGPATTPARTGTRSSATTSPPTPR